MAAVLKMKKIDIAEAGQLGAGDPGGNNAA